MKGFKFLLLPALIGMMLIGCSNEDTKLNYAGIFDSSIVHTLDITLTEEDWAATLNAPLSETYFKATITYDDQTISNVGFRTKGNSSLKSIAQSDSERYSFRIKIDKYIKDQSLNGLNEFVINNVYADASYMREVISYEIMAEMGLIVPEVAYVNVTINGTFYGLYVAVEAIDDSYLARNFDNSDGNLYKAEQGSTLKVNTANTFDQKNGDDTSRTDLIKLIESLENITNGDKGDIESILDVDSVLKMIDSNDVIANFESIN